MKVILQWMRFKLKNHEEYQNHHKGRLERPEWHTQNPFYKRVSESHEPQIHLNLLPNRYISISVGGSPAPSRQCPKVRTNNQSWVNTWCPYFQSQKIQALYSDPVSPWAADHLQCWRASCLSSDTAILSSCVWKIRINKNQSVVFCLRFLSFCGLFAKLISESPPGLLTHSMK